MPVGGHTGVLSVVGGGARLALCAGVGGDAVKVDVGRIPAALHGHHQQRCRHTITRGDLSVMDMSPHTQVQPVSWAQPVQQ
jgi:hypothetical protein